MAKWGEGDPRWIVEERKDATNVNNWHWTERDVSSWSSERLRELLQAVRVQGSEGVCQLTDVSRLDGEASINNRKGKLIFFYEWQLTANWLGTSSVGVKFRGTLEVSNLSDENDVDELDISVAMCKDQPPTALLNLMRSSGVKEVRRALGLYISQLRSEFSQGMILPTSSGAKAPPPQTGKSVQKQITPSAAKSPTPCVSVCSPAPSSDSSSCSFSLTETFQTSSDELYRTFITKEFVEAFTRSAAVVDGCCGGRFQLMDGSVSGEFTELVPNQKIRMKWRFRTWPKDVHAAICLTLQQRGEEESTVLQMDCSGVPVRDEDATREGWRRFYFSAIKQTFAY